MFNGTNKNCKESIFEIQFTGNTSDGAFHQHVLHYWVAAPVLRGWDEIRPSQMILDEFRKEGRVATTGNLDSRAYATMFLMILILMMVKGVFMDLSIRTYLMKMMKLTVASGNICRMTCRN